MFALLKNFFFGAGNRKEETTSPEQSKVDSYRMLIECLQAASAVLPEGKAYIVQASGEFTISLTWKPEEGGNAPSQIGRPDLFVEVPDEETVPVKDKAAKAADPEKAEEKEEEKEEKEKTEKAEKPSRQQLMMQRLVRHLKLRYAFRYNRLTERTECARLDPEAVEDSHHLTYKPVDTRTLNSISLSGRYQRGHRLLGQRRETLHRIGSHPCLPSLYPLFRPSARMGRERPRVGSGQTGV